MTKNASAKRIRPPCRNVKNGRPRKEPKEPERRPFATSRSTLIGALGAPKIPSGSSSLAKARALAAASPGISGRTVPNSPTEDLPLAPASVAAAKPSQVATDKMSISRKHLSVAWNISAKVQFWRKIGADEFICTTVKDGYRIPFLTFPEPSILSNNQSALNRKEFVELELSKLLDSNCIEKCSSAPEVVNPLSVSERSDGKCRLILDLRHINKHLFKFGVKYEGLEILSQYLVPNGFFIKFDLKSGYHHLGIFPPHQKYLGFSWKFGDKVEYFMFRVLPFGLSSACNIFTKLLRPIVKKWRTEGMKVVMYLDDGICTNESRVSLQAQVKVMRNDLINLGFIVNEEKSCWDPVSKLVWLGFFLDLEKYEIKLPEVKSIKLHEKIQISLHSKFLTARKLSSIVGLLNSFQPALGPVVQFMSRSLQLQIIQTSASLDSPLIVSNDARRELEFWLGNLRLMPGKYLGYVSMKFIDVFSDASSYAGGGYAVGYENVAHRVWSNAEAGTSSTVRELLAIQTVLVQLVRTLESKGIRIHTDNKNAEIILIKGSTSPHLHKLATDIHTFAVDNNMTIFPVWIPREENCLADEISKSHDLDDWEVSQEVFDFFDAKWGPHKVDLFADAVNTKCIKFFAKGTCRGSTACDAFSQSWAGANCWITPPISLVSRTLRHAEFYRAYGTMVVPKWKSSSFWPLLVDSTGSFKYFVRDFIEYQKPKNFFKKNNPKNVFNECSKSNILVLRIDFRAAIPASIPPI